VTYTYSTEFSQSLSVTFGNETCGLVKASPPPHNMLFVRVLQRMQKTEIMCNQRGTFYTYKEDVYLQSNTFQLVSHHQGRD